MTYIPDDQLDRLRDLIDLPDVQGTRYEIVRKIATGGMGTVYLARDTSLHRNVAMKVLTVPDENGDLTHRMADEANVVAQLEHPGIVPIHDIGRLSDGRVFYTMKYVEGTTLESFGRGSDDFSDTLRMFLKLCDAIGFAHSRKCIHRDLKPSNIMVGPFGEVLVMDWGLAKRGDSNAAAAAEAGAMVEPPKSPPPAGESPAKSSATAEGTILGTPGYMSPEQAMGGNAPVDARTDIYALGAVLYFLLTGLPPFAGDITTVTRRVIAGDFQTPRIIDRRIPKPLEAICLRAMAKEPGNRYPAAEAMAEDIANYLDGHSVGAYRENLIEKAGRWIGRNRFIVLIVVAYMIVRFLILFFMQI